MTSKNKPTYFLEIRKLNKKFDDFLANNDISLRIGEGEIHALLGENGAGKSTLVKCLYGVVEPTSGKIIIDNRHVNIKTPKEARSLGIGMVFQHFSLFPALTVSENILISLDEKTQKKELEKRISLIANEGVRIGSDNASEGMVLGDKLEKVLLKILDIIQAGGVNSAGKTTPIRLADIESLRSTMNEITSNKHFLDT